MDVRCAPRVRNRLDGAEVVLPRHACHKPAKSLEVGISLFLVAGAGVKVSTVVVHLPDFNHCVAHRHTFDIGDPAMQVRDGAHRRGKGIVDHDQVIIGIEWEFVGVKRAIRLRGGACELFSEPPGRPQNPDRHSDGSHPLNQVAAVKHLQTPYCDDRKNASKSLYDIHF